MSPSDTCERQTGIRSTISSPSLTSKYKRGTSEHAAPSDLFRERSRPPLAHSRLKHMDPSTTKSCRVNQSREEVGKRTEDSLLKFISVLLAVYFFVYHQHYPGMFPLISVISSTPNWRFTHPHVCWNLTQPFCGMVSKSLSCFTPWDRNKMVIGCLRTTFSTFSLFEATTLWVQKINIVNLISYIFLVDPSLFTHMSYSHLFLIK